jgi:hypothetical protein
MCAAVMTDCILYGAYLFDYFRNGSMSPTLYYCAFVLFFTYHWVLAHRYFASSIFVPYALHGKQVPVYLKRISLAVLWSMIVLIFISSGFTFYEGSTSSG